MNSMLRAGRLLLAALSLIAAAAAMASAVAQEPDAEGSAGSPAALPSDLDESEIDALLARLPDDRVRALLLAELKAAARARDAAANAAGEEGLVGGVDAGGVKLKQTVEATVASLGAIPSTAAKVYRRLAAGPGPGEGGPLRLLVLVLVFAVLIAAGAAVEAWYHRRTADVRARIAGAPPGSAGVRIGRGLLRAFLDLMALGAFALPVVVLFVVMEPPNETARMFVAAFFAAILIVRFASLVSRIVLAPAAPALRMVPAKDEDARYLHRRVVQVAAVWAFGATICELMLRQGLAIEAYRLLSAAAGIVVIALFISMFRHFRTPVGNAIKGPDFDHADLEANPPGLRLRAQVGDLWHVIATAYVLIAWVVQVFGAFTGNDRLGSAAIASVVLVLLLPAASYAVRRLLEAAFSGSRAAEGREESEPVYVDAIMRSVNVLLVLFTIALLWTAWGGDPRASAAATVGEATAAAVFDVILILVIADMLWKITHTAIDRRLEREGIDPGAPAAAVPGGDGEGGGGGSRAGTLLPLARKTVATVLAMMVVFTILSAFGVDIGPLLAGAGVAGIAIGFGAQSLVRDIASGVFFLIDDAFRVGEYIDVGEAKGTVEHISLRSVRLRHHRGPLNTVPFGEIKTVQNLSRDWVLMKLEFRVPYDTDVERVRKIIKRIGAGLLEDPVMGGSFLAPLKSQGVYAMEDSAMVIRVKFMARPGEQFIIRREAFRRIREAFEAEGISFAHRIVTVRGANGPDTDPKEAEAAAAASAATQEEAALPQPG